MVTYEDIIKYPAGSKERHDLLMKMNEENCLKMHLKDTENMDFPSYNKTGDFIDTTYTTTYEDFNTLEIFNAHKKLMKMLEDCKKDVNKRFLSPTGYDIEKVGKVRDIAQMWLDGLLVRTGFSKKMSIPKMLWYKLTGQYQKRYRMFLDYLVAYTDMVAKFDNADGGLDKGEEEQPQHGRIGF